MNETQIINYLETKYEGSFEVLNAHHLVNEANPDENAPYEIKCINGAFPERPFYIFVEFNKDLNILEDQYPATLISIYLENEVSEQLSGSEELVQNFALKFSSSSTKELHYINSIKEVEELLSLNPDDFLYIYYSLVENEYDEEKLTPLVDNLIQSIFSITNCTLNLECNFYQEKEEKLLSPDISYDPEADFGNRYKHEERIRFRWIGTFSPDFINKQIKTNESLSKGMRKIQNYKFKE